MGPEEEYNSAARCSTRILVESTRQVTRRGCIDRFSDSLYNRSRINGYFH